MGLVRIKRVPLVNVGEYMLSEGGKVTFTEKMLASAIEHGRGLRARLGIGHIDERYNVSASRDADLSFGQVDSPTLEFDGKTLWGDLVNVDERLAQVLPSNLPSRSIEGDILPDGTLRLTAVKLLGMTLPGVTDIPDIKELVREQEGVFVAASTADQEGTPFTVVLDMTTPVAASATNDDPKEDQTMDEKLRASLIALHGLADDATDEAIMKAVADAAVEAEKANDKKNTDPKGKINTPDGDEDESTEDEDEDGDEPTDAAELEDALAVAASHGLVVMPKSQFKTLRVAATKGAEAHDRLTAEDKNKEMREHLERGAVTPDDVEKEWGPLYDKDPERCKRIMASLPDGMRAPTGRQGKVGDVDLDTNDKDDPFGGGSGLFPDLYQGN